VIMRERREGLLKIVQSIPALSSLGSCKLHRLCMSSNSTLFYALAPGY
jgi:hypothetical protein